MNEKRWERVGIEAMRTLVCILSAGLVLVGLSFLGIGGLKTLVRLDFLPQEAPLLSFSGIVLFVLAVFSISNKMRERLLDAWHSLNHSVAWCLWATCIALNYAQRWKL